MLPHEQINVRVQVCVFLYPSKIRKMASVILRYMKQVAGGDNESNIPRLTGDIVAHPDITMEALIQMHPAERRMTLARSEAMCLTQKSTVKQRASSYNQPSKWLRSLMKEQGVIGNIDSFRTAKEVVENGPSVSKRNKMEE